MLSRRAYLNIFNIVRSAAVYRGVLCDIAKLFLRCSSACVAAMIFMDGIEFNCQPVESKKMQERASGKKKF
jgi:hypothetical protein